MAQLIMSPYIPNGDPDTSQEQTPYAPGELGGLINWAGRVYQKVRVFDPNVAAQAAKKAAEKAEAEKAETEKAAGKPLEKDKPLHDPHAKEAVKAEPAKPKAAPKPELTAGPLL